MLKHISFAILLTLLAGGICLEPVASAADGCSVGYGKRAVKLASTTAGYPQECRKATCAPLTMMAKKTHWLYYCQFGACTPLLEVLDFRYQLKSGSAEALVACPADVSGAVWYPASQDVAP